jgi:hypothetical protein
LSTAAIYKLRSVSTEVHFGFGGNLLVDVQPSTVWWCRRRASPTFGIAELKRKCADSIHQSARPVEHLQICGLPHDTAKSVDRPHACLFSTRTRDRSPFSALRKFCIVPSIGARSDASPSTAQFDCTARRVHHFNESHSSRKKRLLISLLSVGFSKDPKDLETRNNLYNSRLSRTYAFRREGISVLHSPQLLELHVAFRSKGGKERGCASALELSAMVDGECASALEISAMVELFKS